MRSLRLISTTAAILLLGAGAVSAQDVKTDDTTLGVPPALQSGPAEKMAPAMKPDQLKVPEKIGQAAPTAPEPFNKPQTTDKSAPAGAAVQGSSDADGSATVKSKRTAHRAGARYASGHRGPLYDSYRGDRYRGCRRHGHTLTPWLWC